MGNTMSLISTPRASTDTIQPLSQQDSIAGIRDFVAENQRQIEQARDRTRDIETRLKSENAELESQVAQLTAANDTLTVRRQNLSQANKELYAEWRKLQRTFLEQISGSLHRFTVEHLLILSIFAGLIAGVVAVFLPSMLGHFGLAQCYCVSM